MDESSPAAERSRAARLLSGIVVATAPTRPRDGGRALARGANPRARPPPAPHPRPAPHSTPRCFSALRQRARGAKLFPKPLPCLLLHIVRTAHKSRGPLAGKWRCVAATQGACGAEDSACVCACRGAVILASSCLLTRLPSCALMCTFAHQLHGEEDGWKCIQGRGSKRTAEQCAVFGCRRESPWLWPRHREPG